MQVDHTYAVILYAESAARFPENSHLDIDNVPSALGPLRVIYRTDYVDEGFSAAIPRSLWAEISGRAPSLDDAIGVLGQVGSSLGATIAFATNAHVGEFQPQLAFDATDGLTERDFFQSFIRAETGIPQAGRLVPEDALWPLIDAIANSPHRDRINRAIGQYAVALSHWRPGHEIFALAHLYMGMEALTKVAVRQLVESEGCNTEQQLIERLEGVDDGHQLEVHARRSILFGGELDLYRDARKASDDFEHGMANFDVIHQRAVAVRDRTAHLLRRAIVSSSGVAEPHATSLLSSPHDEPKEWWGYARHVRAKIVSETPTAGTTEALAQHDKQYPMLTLKQRLTRFDQQSASRYEIDIETEATALLADGLKFEVSQIQVLGPKPDP
jgi:hypothetical protein